MKEWFNKKIVIPILIVLVIAIYLPKSAPNRGITARIFEIRSNESKTDFFVNDITPPGYDYSLVHWSDFDIPVPYYLSTTIPTSWRPVIQNATKTWNDVPSSYFNFSYAGVTTIGAPHMYDGTNVVSSTYLDGPDNTLAYCVTWFYADSKELIEFDIVLDSSENWSTTTICPAKRLRRTERRDARSWPCTWAQ